MPPRLSWKLAKFEGKDGSEQNVQGAERDHFQATSQGVVGDGLHSLLWVNAWVRTPTEVGPHFGRIWYSFGGEHHAYFLAKPGASFGPETEPQLAPNLDQFLVNSWIRFWVWEPQVIPGGAKRLCR